MSEYERLKNQKTEIESKSFKSLLVSRRTEIKEMLPTAREIEVLDFIKRTGKVGSDDICSRFNISVQNANASLNKLWRKGFLDRRDVGHATGGSYYEYEMNF